MKNTFQEMLIMSVKKVTNYDTTGRITRSVFGI